MKSDFFPPNGFLLLVGVEQDFSGFVMVEN